jgi:predicted RNA binding protein YcfA (HicA-like mRNA interferase family)
MPPFGPIKRRDLIEYLGNLGFSGPTSRGQHQHMKKGDITLTQI